MRGQGWVENKSWGCTKDLPNSGGHGGAEGNDGDRDGMVMGTRMVMMVAMEGATVMKLEMVVNINVLKPAVSQMPQRHETSSQRRSPEALPCTLNCKPRPTPNKSLQAKVYRWMKSRDSFSWLSFWSPI